MDLTWIALLVLGSCMAATGTLEGGTTASESGNGSTPMSGGLNGIPPPVRLSHPMPIHTKQINDAGPPNPYPRSKAALALPELAIDDPVLLDDIMTDIREGIKYVFQTKNDFTFPIHGTGHTAMSAVLDNLIEPGDKVLVMSIGYFGERMANMSERFGANLTRYRRALGTRFSYEEIKEALLTHRPKVLALVYGESDTGVKQHIDGIGDLTRELGALLIVDVVGIGGLQPVRMEELKIDAIYTSANRLCSGVPGLAPLSLGPRAVEKLRTRKTTPRVLQTDLLMQGLMWNSTERRRLIHVMSLPLLYSLREALATVAEEGVENVFKRHENAYRQLVRGLEELGLEHYVPVPEDRLLGIVVMQPPKGKHLQKIIDFMFKNSNIAISNGYGYGPYGTKERVLRIAAFGTNAYPQKVTNVLQALEQALLSPETDI